MKATYELAHVVSTSLKGTGSAKKKKEKNTKITKGKGKMTSVLSYRSLRDRSDKKRVPFKFNHFVINKALEAKSLFNLDPKSLFKFEDGSSFKLKEKEKLENSFDSTSLFRFEDESPSLLDFKNGSKSQSRDPNRKELIRFREPTIGSHYPGISLSLRDKTMENRYLQDEWDKKHLIKHAYNPIYCFPHYHYEWWDSDSGKHWDGVSTYFTGSDTSHDSLILNYKDIYKLPMKGNYLSQKMKKGQKSKKRSFLSPALKLDSEFSSSIDSKKNVFLAGPGTLSYLLDEYTPIEIERMDRHYRLLLEICYKKIRILKRDLFEYQYVNFESSFEVNEKIARLLKKELKKLSRTSLQGQAFGLFGH
jgi:hypothetical protein